MSELLYLDPLPEGIRYLRDEQYLRLKERGEAPAEPHLKPRRGGSFENGTSHINLRCRTCFGEGTFKFWNPDRTDVATYVCPCLDQWNLSVALQYAGVNTLYQRFWWADINREVPVPETYLTDPLRHVRAGKGLALLGDSGTGKTLLSSLIIKGLLGLGVDSYFTTFQHLIDTFRDGWSDKEDSVYFHNRIKGAEVLAIDDIGKENDSEASRNMVRALVDDVFRHRVSSARSTIISSNEDEEKITGKYGSGLESLLSEATVFYSFRGEDYRPTWLNTKQQEEDMGMTRPITLGGKRAVYDESDGEPTLLDFG